MSPTSTRTRLPQHSTGWAALRIITDRAGKYQTTGPAQWLRAGHRHNTADELRPIINYRLQRIITAATLTTGR